MITKIAISGYRSLRDIKLGLGGLNVVTGAAALLAELEASADVTRIVLEKELGEIIVQANDAPAWIWPQR